MIELTVGRDGRVVGLQNDLLDQMDLGPRQVERATDISFNGDQQLWETRLIEEEHRWENGDGTVGMERLLSPVLFSHRERAKCLEWEKRNTSLIASFKRQAAVT
jgi:hypothetical protein